MASTDRALEGLQREHARALARRDRLLARATFWERRRGVLMLPGMLLAGAAGWLLGSALRAALGLPEKTQAFGAVIAVVLFGQGIHAYFNVRRLEAARHRLDAIEQRMRRRG